MTQRTTARPHLARKLSWLAVAGLTTAALAAPGAAVQAAVDYATVTGHEAHSAAANSEDYWGQDCTKLESGNLGDSYVLTSDYGLVVVKSGAGAYANTEFANAENGQTVWADTNGDSVYDEGDQGISHIIFCDPMDEPTPTPTGSVEPTATPTGTVEPTPTPTGTVEPTPTPTGTVEPTPTPTGTVEPTPTPTGTVEPTPTPTPSGSVGGATGTPAPTPTPTGSVAGATGTPGTTLPATDTIGSAGNGSTGESWRLIVLAMAGFLAAALLLTPANAVARTGRRR